MSSDEYQKVRFTGKRTGLDAIRVKGYGLVHQGQSIEVSVDQAEAWTTPLTTGDGKEASDFVKVGGTVKRTAEEVEEQKQATQERLAERAEGETLVVSETSPPEASDEGTGS
jgi:hypothetical protein